MGMEQSVTVEGQRGDVRGSALSLLCLLKKGEITAGANAGGMIQLRRRKWQGEEPGGDALT